MGETKSRSAVDINYGGSLFYFLKLTQYKIHICSYNLCATLILLHGDLFGCKCYHCDTSSPHNTMHSSATISYLFVV